MGGITKKQLNEAQGLWSEAETPEPGQFGEIPDGKYRAEIVEALMDSREFDGVKRLQLNIQWKVLGPTNEGRRAFQNFGLDNTKGCEAAKGTLAMLGVEIPSKLGKLPPLLEPLTGTVGELNLKTGQKSKKTGKRYQNAYLNKVFEGGEEGGEEGGGEEQDLAEMELEGQQVSFEDGDGDEVTGEVTSQDGTELTVEDEDGDEWTVEAEDVTLVEGEGEGEGDGDETLEKGDRVTAEIDDETYAGKIIKIKGDDDDEAVVEFDDGDKRTIPLDELSAEEEEGGDESGDGDDDAEYIGKTVTFEADEEDHSGKVIADDNDGSVTVLDDEGEEWTMEYDDVTVVEEEEAAEGTEETEVKEKKGSKKKKAKKKTSTGRAKTSKKSGKAKGSKKKKAKKAKKKKKTRRV